LVGVFVAVLVAVFVGVFVAVLVGVFVGVFVGVVVAVLVGVMVAQAPPMQRPSLHSSSEQQFSAGTQMGFSPASAQQRSLFAQQSAPQTLAVGQQSSSP
jgi:hypothetical protein